MFFDSSLDLDIYRDQNYGLIKPALSKKQDFKEHKLLTVKLLINIKDQLYKYYDRVYSNKREAVLVFRTASL